MGGRLREVRLYNLMVYTVVKTLQSQRSDLSQMVLTSTRNKIGQGLIATLRVPCANSGGEESRSWISEIELSQVLLQIWVCTMESRYIEFPGTVIRNCFPETLNVPQVEVEGNIDGLGKQNSLFPVVPVMH